MYDLFVDKIEDLGIIDNIRWWKVRCNICKDIYNVRAANAKTRGRTVCVKCSPALQHGKNLGNRSHPLYGMWALVLRRVDNTNVKKLSKDYYYDGISICEEWKDFNTFTEWAEKSGYKKGLTIDRIDPKGDYEPLNCRWVDLSVQSANKNVRSTSTTGYTGITLTNRTAQPYASRLTWKGKTLLQKRFTTIEEAIEARNEMILKHELPHPIQKYKGQK